ncbi:MAG TPA: hemerythrin domain-containing protein [Anaerolineales bacterium]|nr:hemerythrin domain-containing protein [Anaerolineales bacterium]
MEATQFLMAEHDVILRVLTAMQTALAAIPNHKVQPGFFLAAADFIKNFADGCHHAKEEGVLFVEMEASGISVKGGPIGAMLADHEQGREYTRSLQQAAERWQDGDVSAVAAVVVNAAGYIDLLRSHIHKENMILFPMADRVVPVDRQDTIWEAFERVERQEIGMGVHEKYEALAEKLALEAAGY